MSQFAANLRRTHTPDSPASRAPSASARTRKAQGSHAGESAKPTVHEATPGESILQRHALPQNLHQAIEKGDVAAVRRFLRSVGTSCQRSREALEAPRALTFWGVKYTPLMHAAISGNEEIVQLLLEAGASVSTANGGGMTALMLAARHGRITVLSILVQKRQNFDSKDSHGNTAALLAAKSGHPMAVRVLADAGADLDCRDENGLNALAWAAMGGHTGIVKTLAGNGVDVNLRDRKQCTALYYAVRMNRLETVNALLELGADTKLQYPIPPLIRNDIIYFIDEVAGHFGNYDVMELLVRHMHGRSRTSVLKRPESFMDITPAMMSVYYESGLQLEADAMEWWVFLQGLSITFQSLDVPKTVMDDGTPVDLNITKNNLQCAHQRANEIMSTYRRSTRSGDVRLGLYPNAKWLETSCSEWQAHPARAASIVGVMGTMPAALPNSRVRALLKQGWRSELASAINEAWMRVAPAASELRNLSTSPAGEFQLLDMEGKPLQLNDRLVEDILFSFALSVHSEQIQQLALSVDSDSAKTGVGKPGRGPVEGLQPPHADPLVQRQAQALIAANRKGPFHLRQANSAITIKGAWELCEAAREGLLQHWLVTQFISQFTREERKLPYL
jgi:hypothetical protein